MLVAAVPPPAPALRGFGVEGSLPAGREAVAGVLPLASVPSGASENRQTLAEHVVADLGVFQVDWGQLVVGQARVGSGCCRSRRRSLAHTMSSAPSTRTAQPPPRISMVIGSGLGLAIPAIRKTHPFSSGTGAEAAADTARTAAHPVHGRQFLRTQAATILAYELFTVDCAVTLPPDRSRTAGRSPSG
jgi:hypothetical protein